MPHSLRSKLMLVVVLTTLVALGVALGAMVAYDIRDYHRAWIEDVSTQAELLGQATAVALSFDDPKVATENLSLLRFRPHIRAAAVYNAKGELFASFDPSGSADAIPAMPALEGATFIGSELVVARRIVDHGETLGTIYLRADYALRDRIRSYLGIALAVACVAMLVALALSYRLQTIVTRPILAISAVAREVVQQHDYSRRAQKMSEDEVGTLVESFNRMMSEVEQHAQETRSTLLAVEREVGERRTAQLEVMRLNEELERRVKERTAELEASNRELTRATEAAEKANLAKSEFLSSMSHELRTPLNAILGFGQLLSSSSFALSETKRADFTQQILKAGRHLLNLISEILDLAKIESANLMLSLEPVGLSEMLDECRTLIGPAADQHNIRMLMPTGSEQAVVADRTRLKQVLLNLLSNAIKYNRENGTVIVDWAFVGKGRVRVSVQDTGPGLRPDQLGALFQPFNRLGQEAGKIEGTGIGLVVTRRLVELMGGTVDVKSTVGVGSVFSLELLAAESRVATAGAAVIGKRKAFEPGEVPITEMDPLLLHVEDNPANLQLVEEIVSLRGDMRQMSAPDARLGIELARAHRPRVILMDLNLPGLNGKDALAILLADPETAHIPVIALTANAMARDVAQGTAAGFFRYLTKPVEVDRLNEAIDSALSASAPSP